MHFVGRDLTTPHNRVLDRIEDYFCIYNHPKATMKLVGFLPLFLSSVAAFTTPATTARGGSIAKTTSTSTLASSAVTASPPVADEETWYEAIQLANRRKTDIGECERLAAQLESVGDCEFESKDSDTCATEIADRLELAKILRLKVELQQR